MDEPEHTALTTPSTMTAVSTLPTVSTSTRNEPRATSTGTASTVSVRLLTHKTRMIWRQPSQMWNVNSTKPTTRLLWKARTSATPRFGTRSATAPFPTCCPAARPARKRPYEEVGAVPGTQGSAGHERVRRPSVGYRAGQVPQDHADHCCTSAREAPETGGPAERQRTGQGESTGFRSATAEPLAGRANTAEAICTAYRREVEKSFSIIVRGDVY